MYILQCVEQNQLIFIKLYIYNGRQDIQSISSGTALASLTILHAIVFQFDPQHSSYF